MSDREKAEIPWVGVISDTHDLLRPGAVEALGGARLILHAGDVCNPGLLGELGALAEVHAVRGNCDRGEWARSLPLRRTLEIEGRIFHMVHDLADFAVPGDESREASPDLVVFGHSHRPEIALRDGTIFLNPGSAGPRRFRLPISVARVHLHSNRLRPELVRLE